MKVRDAAAKINALKPGEEIAINMVELWDGVLNISDVARGLSELVQNRDGLYSWQDSKDTAVTIFKRIEEL